MSEEGTKRTDERAPLHTAPVRGHESEKARLRRLEFFREQSGCELESLSETRLDPEKLTSNIESMIGGVEIPVGIAGPLLFRGHETTGGVYLPIATTEGNLVTSATRGALAISRSGGVYARTEGQRMTRAPLFVVAIAAQTPSLRLWLEEHFDLIRERTARVSEHADLVAIEPFGIGRAVHVRFVYRTGDAAGQNMVTTCTWHACQWILEQLSAHPRIQIQRFFIDGNLSTDKKASFASLTSGRGTRVMAECHLSGRVLRRILKVAPEHLLDANLWMMAGAAQGGMIGYNINISNVLAGVFIATGQDAACVQDSAIGVFSLRPSGDGIEASLVLPSLIVGTVGGGTHLPTQRDFLSLLNCAGSGKVERFAEIIAGFCLALDLSTLSAVTNGQFAIAHERVGRAHKVQWLTDRDLTPRFIEDCMQQYTGDTTLRVQSAVPQGNVEIGSSILTALTSRNTKKLVGHFPMQIAYTSDSSSTPIQRAMMCKVKPIDEEVISLANSMAGMGGEALATVHGGFKRRTGFAGCHIRELAVYRQTDPRFTRHTPQVFGIYEDQAREAHVILLELLDDVELLNSADDPSGWTPPNIACAVDGIATMHSIWYGREPELVAQTWLGYTPNAVDMIGMRPLWHEFIVHASTEFPELFEDDDLALHDQIISSIDEWWPAIERHRRTLIHNDFNPRNVALRRTESGPRLVAYDWELATLHLPQHDVAEFLAFVLPEHDSLDEVAEAAATYCEQHRRMIEQALEVEIDAQQWMEGFDLSVKDLMVNRFGQYLLAHTFKDYGFLPRSLRTLRKLARLHR